MNNQTYILLRKMRSLLVDFLEVANLINEKDFREIVVKAQKNKQQVKGVIDNVSRGNLFMTIFFVRELIESLLNE